MPRKYSNDDEYNLELEKNLANNEYVANVVNAYKKFENEFIKPKSEDMQLLGGCNVPQEEYEGKADEQVCAPDKTAITNNTNIEDEVSNILSESEKEAQTQLNCISGDGPDSLTSIAEEIKEKAEKLSELKQIKDRFDEFYYNAQFLERYLNDKNSRKSAVKLISKRKPIVVFAELKIALATYSTSVNMMYESLGNRIALCTVYISDYNDLKNYTRLGTSSDKLSIFRTRANFKLSNPGKLNAKGSLYKKYYDTLSDPIENLFTLSEKGMSKRNTSGDYQVASMDSNGNPISYIADTAKYKEFYQTLDKKIQEKSKSLYKEKCGLQVDIINNLIDELVECESKKIMTKNDKNLIKYFEEFHEEYTAIESEIAKLESELSTESINKRFAKNPCFAPTDIPSAPEVEDDLTGGFKLPAGKNQDNPTFDQSCYWVKLCGLATTFGLLPYLEPVSKMRYWGIGLKLFTPSGIVNIPMPTIWIPIVTLSTKFGVIVVLIGQIGAIPHPFILRIGKDGVVRFIVTMNGINLNGDVIGYDPNDLNNIKIPDKIFSIPKPNLQLFSKLVEGSFNLEKFLNIQNKEDLEEDTIDISKFNEITMESTMQDINKLMRAFDEKKEKLKEALPISDMLLKVSQKLHGYIDDISMPELPEDKQVKLEEFMNKYEATLSDVEEYTELIVNSITINQIVIPDDLDILKYIQIPSQTKFFDDMIATLESIDLPNVNLADLKQVKGYITTRIAGIINSGEIQKWIIENIPEELDLELEEDFNKAKEFLIKTCDNIISKINPMIWYSATKLLEYLSKMTTFSASMGIGCKGFQDDLDLEIDPVFKTIISTINSIIHASLDGITYDMVKQYITNRILKRSQLLDFAKYLIEELLPDYELPFDMEINPYQILLKIIKVMKLLSDPKAALEPYVQKLLSDYIPRIVIDINKYKTEIIKFINSLVEKGLIPLSIYSLTDLKCYLHGIVSMVFEQQVPMFLYKQVAKVFGTVDDIENYITVMVKELLPQIFAIVDLIKDTIEKINKVSYVIKLIKNADISKNSLDNAFAPQVILQNVQNIALCAVGLGTNCEKLPSLCDINLVEKAIEILKKTNIQNFLVVSAACWANRNNAEYLIRMSHPLMVADDLPPYERLSLNNSLFCLFLDDFCHYSKQFAVYGEKYGYA